MKYYLDQIKENFLNQKWYKVYDFVEFLLKSDLLFSINKKTLKNNINQIFIEDNVPYKIINNSIVPLMTKIEKTEIEDVFNNNDKYSISIDHINNAVELYVKRPKGDYKNSIKESISSIEALVRIISRNENATLGSAISNFNIHPELKDTIKKLYKWASDESGIRHSGKKTVFDIKQEEARLSLIICSGLLNYIISKDKK